MNYKEELCKSMKLLSENPKTLLLGQTVKFEGTSMFHMLKDFSDDRKIELPVTEEMQMGISLGLSLEGYIPISVYPRMDFLILAINQLVNHIDKCEEMSDGQFKPKVIIRTAIGSVEPLMAGPQHSMDHTEALKLLCTNIDVIRLDKAEDVLPAYKKALESDRSTILVEIPDLYNKDLEDLLKKSREVK